jgi:hypothetical protein
MLWLVATVTNLIMPNVDPNIEPYWRQLPPPQLIPYEYQGWLFIIFVIFSTLFLLYGFYLIATDKSFNKVKQ